MSDVGIVNLDRAQFAECPTPDGSVTGEIAWAKEGRAALWRADAGNMPARAPYRFDVDEVVFVVEGAVEIALDNGDTVPLGIGDLAHFPAGHDSEWRFSFPFAKVSVLFGGDRRE